MNWFDWILLYLIAVSGLMAFIHGATWSDDA